MIEAQLQMMRQMLPDAKKLGIMYTTSEANSVSAIEEYEKLSGDYGFQLVTKGITATADIPLAADELLSEVDCMTNLTDNTVVSSLSTILDKANEKKIPVFGSEIEQVKIGCLAAEGIDYIALGEQTGKMAAQVLNETYEEIGYEDTEADLAILTLEADVLPGEDVAQYIADECNVDVKDVYLLVAPTSSLVGSIQISGRVVENGTYKMLEAIKFDVTKVKHAAGIAPIAPIDPDGLKAMGKTNDAVLFGGRTYYYVESDENDDIADVAAKLPSSAADGYGKPFFDVFKEAEFDFYKIDKGMFAPAEVVINDLTTGKIYKEGYVNVDLLKKSFGVDN